ncbi:MAG TPA: 2-dehydropantoate 2-reductase [Longimicrobiales bacterium]
MKFAIVGAGAVGSNYAGELARAGHEVRILARGAHLDALVERGLEVRGPDGTFTVRPHATGDAAALGAVDAVIVAVKAYSLAEVAPTVVRLAEAGALVLPLLNGVDIPTRLEAAGVPSERLLAGVTYISVARVAPGVVERYSPFQRIRMGVAGGGTTPEAEAVAAALREAGVDAIASETAEVEIWRKLVFLASFAGMCGLARSAIGAVREAPYGRDVLRRAVAEAAAVARARGVALPADEEARAMAVIEEFPDTVKPSFLMDLEAGGPNELDVLSGSVARLGREAGVATPVHDAIVAALSARTA